MGISQNSLKYFQLTNRQQEDDHQARFVGRAPAVTMETTVRGPNGEQQYEVSSLLHFVCPGAKVSYGELVKSGPGDGNRP